MGITREQEERELIEDLIRQNTRIPCAQGKRKFVEFVTKARLLDAKWRRHGRSKEDSVADRGYN